MPTRTADVSSRQSVVARFALATRAAVWALGVAVSLLAHPYDSSATAAAPPPLGWVDAAVHAAVAPFAHWDGVFFVEVAQRGGYAFELFHAFFPLVPLLARAVANTLLWPAVAAGVLSYHTAALLGGFLVCNAAFVAAAVLLYQLGRAVLRADDPAFYAALLFCINPAGIFCSAVYTESVFACASFAGMVLLANTKLCANRGEYDGNAAAVARRRLARLRAMGAASCFALAGLARSNGTLLVGYTAFYAALTWAASLGALPMEVLGRSLPVGPEGVVHEPRARAKHAEGSVVRRLLLWVGFWASVTVQAIIVLGPFVLVQFLGYWHYCAPAPAVVRQLWPLNLPESVSHPNREWCSATPVPSLYGFVQREYWKVGPFKYWEVKQLPNFLLAAPMLGITAWLGGAYLRRAVSSGSLSTLLRVARALVSCSSRRDVAPVHRRASEPKAWDAYHRFEVLPYVLHWVAMAVFAMVLMHVQVATRFLSACPPLYWALACWLLQEQEKAGRQKGSTSGRRQFALVSYFIGYTAVGTTLFCTFYPWT